MLEDYRRSFGEAYEAVIRTIRQRGEFPTGRLAKSTRSIVEKLGRESIRLSQMQDIAGCRVVVANIMQQEQFVASLKTDFVGASVIDRRDKPSYGYRAVHIIAMISGKPVEIQVRTSLQHRWAELSEKSSDVLDPTIKYGGGPAELRRILTKSSEEVASYEVLEATHHKFETECSEVVKSKEEAVAAHEKSKKAVAKLLKRHLPDHEVRRIQGKMQGSTRELVLLEQDVAELQGNVEDLTRKMVRLWNLNADLLAKAISWLDKLKGKKQ